MEGEFDNTEKTKGNQNVSTLKMWLPMWPPTSNEMYITIWDQKRRVLSPKARKFVIDATSYLTQNYFKEISEFPNEENMTYLLNLVFVGPWLTKTEKAKSKFRRHDISNCIKLVEDVVKNILGIDDMANFRLVIDKQHSFDVTGMWIIYSQLEKLG